MNYAQIAKEARIKVLDLIYKAQTSHVGSNMSVIEILTVLYSKVLNIDKSLSEDRDKFIASKGWCVATLYWFLSKKGILDWKEVYNKYCDGKSIYIGLAEKKVRGIEATTGSMGHGLPIGIGMALEAKKNNNKRKVYVLMSDGEQDCGTTWESALLGAHHKLNNLIVIVDCNGFQATGKINEVLKIEPLDKKWKAFNWDVRKIDGHNFKQIEKALLEPSNKPIVILAKTKKGSGISFMENNLDWHYRNISTKLFKRAKEELEYAT